MAKHTRVARTASSNYPRKMIATRSETIANDMSDGTTLVTVAASLMIYVHNTYPIPVLTAVMVRIPMKMKSPAILRAKQNFARCFKLRMNPFHALLQNESPETAM